MGLNFRKRVKIFNGLYLNFGNKGINSASIKVGDVTYNTKGKTTVNIGGGLRYTFGSSRSKRSKRAAADQTQQMKSWVDYTDKQLNVFVIILRILGFLLGTLSLMLAIVFPPMILLSVIGFMMALRFNINVIKELDRKSKIKNS